MIECAFRNDVTIDTMILRAFCETVFLSGQTVIHEVQVYRKEETSLENYARYCPKNPGHKSFVPIREFTCDHLPERYRSDRDVFDLVQTLAALTVKVDAIRVSPERPKYFPGGKDRYLFQGQAKVRRSATGRVCRVELINNKICPCKPCQRSSGKVMEWGEVYMLTAHHMIFDDHEADGATCTLNYDCKGAQSTVLGGLNVAGSEISEDKCWLRYLTHDGRLLRNLKRLVARYDKLSGVLYNRYKPSRPGDRLTVVVSHPHGSIKQVSVGQWTDRVQVDRVRTRYTYTACTCPGTSGATVYTLSMPGWFYVHTHVGAYGVGGGGVCGNGKEHNFESPT